MNPAIPVLHSPAPVRRLVLGVLLGLGLHPALWAADAPNTTPTSEPAKSYTDQGTTTTRYTVDTFGSFNNYNSSFGRFGNYGLGGSYTSTVRTQYRPIYFPAVPPALGEPIPANLTRGSLAKFSPPAVLATYVYEPFYAPLSPLLFSEDLSRRRREKLDAYHAARTTALTGLQARLDGLLNATPEVRVRELTAFAGEQAAALAALENTAEELRANFVDGGFFDSGSNWNYSRDWRLGDDTRWESAADEIKVMVAAASFQDGLSPAQRRLLRELAMELKDSLQAPGSEISLSAPGPFFYFAPETARIRLPAGMSPELTARIQSYQDLKAGLKRELRNVLYQQDRAFWDYKRTNALKALAEQQAGRLAELETRAEEIRAGLAGQPNPASPPAIPLPRELSSRLSTYLVEKAAWQRAMLARLESLRTDFPQDRVEYIRQSSGVVIEIVGNRRSNAETNTRRAVAQAELAAFNAEQSRRYAELARNKEALQAEVLKVATNLAGTATNKSIEQLLASFSYAFARQERWERYHDYEVAVLQPGLSAAQRRLLFGAALEKLDLPLNSSY